MTAVKCGATGYLERRSNNKEMPFACTQAEHRLEGDKELDIPSLLAGRYEAERLPSDFSPERVVPDFAFNALNPLGLLYHPVVDEHHLASGGQKPTWPDGKPFAVCLTHDVDHVSAHSVLQPLRALRTLNGASAKTMVASGIKVIRNATLYGKDPFHCYERWLEVESSIGAHSTFFILPECVRKPHHTDGIYRFSDRVRFDGQRCTVAEMICEIDRQGWEVGLHATWYAFDDADELKRQKEQVERVVGHEIVSLRQHYLHYDIRSTPRAHTEAGFRYDSTLGFNDNVGFRFGTSYPWHLYDLHEAKLLLILEIPLIVQDGALLNPRKGLRLDEEAAFRYVAQMADAVETVGGVLTLLWHADSVAIPSWYNLYHQVLEFLKTRNAWFGSVGEVGKWWQERAFPANRLRSQE